MLRKLFVFIMVASFSVSSLANGRYFYVAKKDEVVSEILYRAGMNPLYKKAGSVEILVDLNTGHIKDINEIHPGQKIYFPVGLAERSRRLGFIEITKDHEIIILNQDPINSSLAQKLSGPDAEQVRLVQDTSNKKPASEEAALGVKDENPTEIENKGKTDSVAVEVEPSKIPKKEPVGLRVQAGVGLNYVQLNEKFSDVSASYKDFRGPNHHFGVGFDLTETDSIEAFYQSVPVQFDNSSVSLAALTGNWQILSVYSTHRRGSHPLPVENGYAQNFRWIWGVDMHDMPIGMFETVGNRPVMRNLQMLNASVGANSERYLNTNTRTQTTFKLQYPLLIQAKTSDADLQAKPQLHFQGSVAIEKQFRPDYWLGFSWNGQYQVIKVDYQDSTVNALGTHSAFFSNMEIYLNVGY